MSDNKYQLYVTGDIFHDFGLLQLYDLLKEKTDCQLTNNFLVFGGFVDSNLYNNIKEALKKIKNEKSKLITFPYMRNSAKWRNFTGIPEEKHQGEVDKNLKEMIRLFILELNNEFDSKYRYDNDTICSICHVNSTPLLDFKGKRVISNSLYPLMGEQNSDKSNYRKENFQICFSCEFLALLSFIDYIDIKHGSIFYSRNLVFNNQLYKILRIKQKIMSEENKLKKLLNYSQLNIKEFRFSFANNQFNLDFLNCFNIQALLKYLELKRVIDNYNFGRNIQKSRILKEIKQENYGLVKGILLSNIVNSRNYEYNEIGTIYNLKNYLEFIKILGGNSMMDSEKKELNIKQIYSKGRELKDVLNDPEKIKKLTLKLIQLLKGNDRNTLLEEILHVLVVNKMTIPPFISATIMEGSEDNLHLSIGSFIEGLNSAKNLSAS